MAIQVQLYGKWNKPNPNTTFYKKKSLLCLACQRSYIKAQLLEPFKFLEHFLISKAFSQR